MDTNPSASEKVGISDEKASSSSQKINDVSGTVADESEEQIRLAIYSKIICNYIDYIWIELIFSYSLNNITKKI